MHSVNCTITCITDTTSIVTYPDHYGTYNKRTKVQPIVILWLETNERKTTAGKVQMHFRENATAIHI